MTFTIANVDARIHSLYKMKIIEILISNEIKNEISTTKFIIFHCEWNSLHSLIFSPFPHSLSISSFSLHFLTARLAGWHNLCSPAPWQGEGWWGSWIDDNVSICISVFLFIYHITAEEDSEWKSSLENTQRSKQGIWPSDGRIFMTQKKYKQQWGTL